MRVSILGAFRESAVDEDRFSKWLRVLKAAYGAVLFGSVVLMSLSAWYVGYEGKPLSHVLIRVMLPSIIMFLFLSSSITVFRTEQPAPVPAAATGTSALSLAVVLSTSTIAFVIFAVEATAFLGGGSLGDMLVWWRRALLILSGGWLFLYAGETTVHVLRSQSRKNLSTR